MNQLQLNSLCISYFVISLNQLVQRTHSKDNVLFVNRKLFKFVFVNASILYLARARAWVRLCVFVSERISILHYGMLNKLQPNRKKESVVFSRYILQIHFSSYIQFVSFCFWQESSVCFMCAHKQTKSYLFICINANTRWFTLNQESETMERKKFKNIKTDE